MEKVRKVRVEVVVNEAINKLITKKKRTKSYNTAIKFKGLEWDMAISTYDNKPFNQKKVYITVWYKMQSKTVAIISPRKAGYTLKEVNKTLKEWR